MTLIEEARRNKANTLIRGIAKCEGVSISYLLKKIAKGEIVIPKNTFHDVARPCGIGKGLRTKVNANIGTSEDKADSNYELEKLDVAVEAGADTVMDLSTGGNIEGMLRSMIKRSCVPVGTVPIYQAALIAERSRGSFLKMTKDDIFGALKTQAEMGVDFFTIHSGVTKSAVSIAQKRRRVLGVVSRGGAMLTAWIARSNKENPLYEFFDDVLDMARKFDITLSLGDGMRPGSILDATDALQLHELRILGGLAKRALKKGVQVIIEGPGHVPLNQIKRNILLQKKICRNAPFYVLGPLVCDVAAGYDHISGAIGGALAAGFGADFLCYVTPSEHLRHPATQDVEDGVIASRIAAHAADIAKGVKGAVDWDRKMSIARKNRDWKEQIKYAVYPRKAEEYRASSLPALSDVCTMCGKFCSLKLVENCVK
ncbi:MAG: phosphomethylpyrimidine synthase ThiC [Candidatus Omnitrophica bacterium]|nr:phosphomethylpyrimidine synthase ThiC [Candidatus Omnitrophota bacterium]